MSDIIRLLPDSVANQIAAGEVIQRPASVVKELVENAVDAGASSIQVVIRDAGRTLIQVVDNGCGMSDTDARMAFERHATSKITEAADLFQLHTMGFRGEALASICAVAQVDLRTMPHGAEMGTRIEISGSKVERQHPEACAPGSNMMVKNLFFNVPARRKFLKKDAVELSNIMREFERLALVNPGIDFSLVNNDVTLHQLLRSSFKQRIVDLFGKALDKQIIPVGTDTSIVRIEGFVSRPEFSRRRNQLQFFTVNGRHMRHPYFHKALMSCYEQLIPADEQPNYFINFTVDPETIDVNIHPTKNEIKFENESAIWQILTAAIRESLGSFNAVPSIDFSSDSSNIDIPVFNPSADARPDVELDPGYNPFKSSAASGKSVPADWERLYEGFERKRDESFAESMLSAVPSDVERPEVAQLPDAGLFEGGSAGEASDFGSIQFKNRFIVTPAKSGLMVVEQHRAHVRILYERYMSMLSDGALAGQKVMFAETLTLTPSQNAILKSIVGDLEGMGFELDEQTPGEWKVNAVPAVPGDLNASDTLLKIIDDVLSTGEDPSASLRGKIASWLAASSAIPAGKALTPGEREHLMEELFRLPTPNYTPDGKLIIRIIPLSDIAAWF